MGTSSIFRPSPITKSISTHYQPQQWLPNYKRTSSSLGTIPTIPRQATRSPSSTPAGCMIHPRPTMLQGKQFDSSVGRGDFQTAIGVGQVIAGWDQGVTQMSLGEKSTLVIPGRMAYGDGGYPGLIPPNATLIFDVHLKGINGKRI